MKIRIARKKPVDPIESGSLSDLAFLLIIYFIVIAGFAVNEGYLLRLPTKGSQRVVNVQDLVKLRLDATGGLALNGTAITVEAADAELRAAVTAKPNLTVLLSIHPDCPWQNVVDVISAAQRNEVENFSFKSEAASESASAASGAASSSGAAPGRVGS